MPARKPLVVFHPEILGGKPVFAGTRIPVHYLAEWLGGGSTLEEFLESYPDVGRERALAVLAAGTRAVIADARPLGSLRPCVLSTVPRRSRGANGRRARAARGG